VLRVHGESLEADSVPALCRSACTAAHLRAIKAFYTYTYTYTESRDLDHAYVSINDLTANMIQATCAMKSLRLKHMGGP
jgi:hypothetical protein